MGGRTKTTIGICALVALLASFLAAGPAGAQAQADSSWIVVLEPGNDPAGQAEGLARGAGGRVGHVYDDLLGGFAFQGSDAAAAALLRNPLVQAVVPDGTLELIDVAGTGFFRIDADLSHPDPNAYRGAGTRSVVIDTGLDLAHTDFTDNVDLANSLNCVTPGASVQDDNSHGTHVTGIIGAELDGTELVGIASDTEILPLKAFDNTGFASTSQLLCAMDRLAEVMIADPMPTVLNMSFVDTGSDTVCNDIIEVDGNGDPREDDVLHEAICDLDELGVIMVAGAGNASEDIVNAVPAQFEEVIAVSALADIDGIPGGAGGCTFTQDFAFDCDDTFADFSNHGPAIDVIAPGWGIGSTVPGGLGVKSGTSMAAPHVAAVAAIMLGEDPTLTRGEILAVLQQTGECPDASINTDGGMCATTWAGDPDGIGEPLVNALRAAEAVAGDPGNPSPVASFTHVCVELSCTFTDTSTDNGPLAGWSWSFGDGGSSTIQHPTHDFASAGTYTVALVVTDAGGATDSASTQIVVTESSAPQPPVADAGPDLVVPDTRKKGTESVQLDGSASTDPDSPIATYTWTDSSGETVASGVQPRVTLAVGTHEITLTVVDTTGLSSADQVSVTVGSPPPPPGNTAPTADAGPDQTVFADLSTGIASVVLDGSGSSDSDGDALSYSWRDAQNNVLATSVTPTIDLPLGIHTVTLTVTDPSGASASDTVTVTVDLTLLWTSHVESLSATTTGRGKRWTATVEVYVMWAEAEDLGSPIGADPSTVTVTTSTGATLQCTTANSDPDSDAEDGRCSVTLTGIDKKQTSAVTFTVVDVWTPGFTFIPDHPHSQMSIVVNAP